MSDTNSKAKPEVQRYRVERTGHGFWPYCVRAGDGSRELLTGHHKQMVRAAAEFNTAFLDGVFVGEKCADYAALSTRVRELEAALPTAHELQRAVDTMGSIIKNPSGHDRWLEDLVPIRNWLRALLPQVPTNVGDGK